MTECEGLPQLAYGDFSEWLHKKIGNQRIPISGSLEVTERCNLRCVHCYISEDRRAKTREPELTLPEIKRILDEITDAGCLWLLLTGGDPFMRKDFLDIYTYARNKGLILTIFTNGTLITPQIADYLAEWRPFKMEITLYGATQETYERITGIPGSYAMCMRGIELLLERNLSLSLKTVLMTLNNHELGQMRSLAERLRVAFNYDPGLLATLDGSHRPLSFRLSPEEFNAIELNDPNRMKSWSEKIEKKIGNKYPNRSLYICGAGKSEFYIDSYGHLSACIFLPEQYFDLRTANFNQGWEKFLPKIVSQEYHPGFACGECNLRRVCSQCPAKAKLENGDPEQVIDFFCHLTKSRQTIIRSINRI